MIKIAIMIPVCSRGQKFIEFNDSPLVTSFLPNFIKTIDDKYAFNFYIGYDDDDEFYIRNCDKLKSLYENCKVYTLTGCQNAPAKAWNILFDRAYKEGNDYFFQIGDDVELKTSGWAEKFINKLQSNNNIGVVGPCEPINYHQRVSRGMPYVIENSFVSRKHYEIFGYFFYPEIKNWYCDNWITESYRPFLSYIFTDIVVSNNIRDQRYQISACPLINEYIAVSILKIKAAH